MKKICSNSGCKQAYGVTDDDLAFYEKISPSFTGRKEPIPPPALCPDCRSRRRMIWRNERSLSLRPCGLCKKMKVSMFMPESPYHAYCHECFFSDQWDPLTYGRPYDVTKTFHANMDALLHDVPLMMLYQTGINENCEYTNQFGPESRNCYLMFNSGRDEDCSYGRGLIESKCCMDMLIGSGDQFCFECINSSECYGVFFSQNVAQCRESAFLFSCRRCTHCFGCTNLVQKEYHLFNKPCTPEEFALHMSRLSSAQFAEEMRAKLAEARLQCIHRENNNINAEGCTGDYITASKNCIDAYETKGAEDCKRLLCSRLCKDSHDLLGYGYDSSLLYDCVGVGLSASVLFSFNCSSISDSAYCIFCDNIQHCFGCIGLRRKQYCIFNRQYSKEEYEETVSRIIASMRKSSEWGEFLPAMLSPYAYNETVAQEYLPLERGQAAAMGFRWSDVSLPLPASRTIPAAELPDSTTDIPDDVLQWAIQCETTKRLFKLTKLELDFYRTHNLPVPRIHPDERHARRMRMRNPCHVWERPCDNCKKIMATTYALDRPETVYCEECYLKEVF